MKEVAVMNIELTVEERNLLSVAYKNVIGSRRASWRMISSVEQKEEGKSNDERVGLVKQYRVHVSVAFACIRLAALLIGLSGFKIEKELKNICYDILKLLDKNLIPSSSSGESKVFYYKM